MFPTEKKTESPIEEFLLQALCAVAKDRLVILQDARFHDLGRLARQDEDRRCIFLAGQVWVEHYRPDFLIAAHDNRSYARIICVECDGVAFHRKFEQLQRDIVRDQWFMARGIPTMRFSGKRIKRDSYACAYEVIEAVTESWSKPEDAGPRQLLAATYGAMPGMRDIEARSCEFNAGLAALRLAELGAIMSRDGFSPIAAGSDA